MLRGITFDLDGTLGDTLPVCYAAFRRFFQRELGREFSDAEIHALFGPCEKGVIERLLPGREGVFEGFLKDYEDSHGLCTKAFPGMSDLLDLLQSRGVRIAVVTGKSADTAAISLRWLGLGGYFELIGAGSPTGAVKPAAIRGILEQWGIQPADAAHIGDAPSDIRAAREAGVTALGAAWASTGNADALMAEAPDAVFEDVADLHRWLVDGPVPNFASS